MNNVLSIKSLFHFILFVIFLLRFSLLFKIIKAFLYLLFVLNYVIKLNASLIKTIDEDFLNAKV